MKKYLFVHFMLATTGLAMDVAPRLPTDIVVEMLLKLAPYKLNNCESTLVESKLAIDSLKNAMHVCKQWYRAGNDVRITNHFMQQINYEPECAVYTKYVINNDVASITLKKQRAQRKKIIQESFAHQMIAAYNNYFLNHPSDEFFHTDIKRRILDGEIRPWSNYYHILAEELERVDAYFKSEIIPSYNEIYAALNLNTQPARQWIIKHLAMYPFRANHTLLVACLYGRNNIVTQLISQMKDPNNHTCDISFPNPIHIAIAYNHPKVVRALLAHPNLDLHALNSYQETPFALALRLGNATIIKMLACDKRVTITPICCNSVELPRFVVPRNTFLDADKFITYFGLKIDPETRDFIRQKVGERNWPTPCIIQ